MLSPPFPASIRTVIDATLSSATVSQATDDRPSIIMAPWLQVLEAYAVAALLRTPAFHRGVEKVARQVHRVRHGIPPEELGGTKLDDPQGNAYLRHFGEELQTQLGLAEARTAAKSARREIPAEGENAEAAWKGSVEESTSKAPKQQQAEAQVQDADGVWRDANREGSEGLPGPKQGFLGEYIGALREQMRTRGR